MNKKKTVIENGNGVNNATENAAPVPMLIMPCEGCKPFVIYTRVYGTTNVNFNDFHRVDGLHLVWQKPDGSLVDVETGSSVPSTSAKWGLLSGAYFENSAGQRFLLSRKYFGKRENFWITGAEVANKPIQCHKMLKRVED